MPYSGDIPSSNADLMVETEDIVDNFYDDMVRQGAGVDRRHSTGSFMPREDFKITEPPVELGGIDELRLLKSVRINLIWWWIGFFASLIAALLFFIGSFFFMPEHAVHIDSGCYMFVTGVLLFWACSAWSTWNFKSRHVGATTRMDIIMKKVDFAAEVVWVLTYCNYLPGSALFLSWLPAWCVTMGAWQFVIGSVFCSSASFIQMIVFLYLNVKGQEPFVHMVLDIASSVSYIVGAVLWLCASVLYLIDVPEDNVYRTAALTYVVGSGFFISGAANALAVNTFRLRAVSRRATEITAENVEKSASREY